MSKIFPHRRFNPRKNLAPEPMRVWGPSSPLSEQRKRDRRAGHEMHKCDRPF